MPLLTTGAGAYAAAAAAAYRGPGEDVSGAFAWYGLQAYTTASIGAVDVITLHTTAGGGSDSSPFRTIAGGGLDMAAINTFAAGGTLSVRTWFDQTGNGWTIGWSTVAEQPLFLTSGINGLPSVQFIAANSHKLGSTAAGTGGPLTDTSGLTMAQVIKFPTFAGSELNFWAPGTAGGNLFLARRLNIANTLNFYRTSSNFSAPATDNVAHSIVWALAGTGTNACDICVDGVSTLGTLGALLSPDTINDMNMGGNGTFGFADAVTTEMGIYNFTFSGAQKTAMYNNQHTRYGV
jgi:hypothetical protein